MNTFEAETHQGKAIIGHDRKGWYFSDEAEQWDGPYPTQDTAIWAFHQHILSLENMPDLDEQAEHLRLMGHLIDTMTDIPSPVVQRILDFVRLVSACTDFDSAIRGTFIQAMNPDCPHMDFKKAMALLDEKWEQWVED
jgi:hypothetical protein